MSVENAIAQMKARCLASHIVISHKVEEELENPQLIIAVKLSLRSPIGEETELTKLLRDVRAKAPKGFAIRFDMTAVV